jgi:ditrans,polycis-polyprenyl diphosphate synthase
MSSSWIRKDERTRFQKFCGNILKEGPVPKHVGFIMDGNRRFAKKQAVPSIEGHSRGFEKLSETLRWCLDFEITEVTVYVFSIENFKRPKEEVEALMKLAKEKFEQLLEEQEKLMEEGVCVQIIGDWLLIPEELKPLMAKAMVLTKNNTRAKLNVAFAYTARNEITRGVQCIQSGVINDDLLPEDIDEDLLSETFLRLPTRPLDLLVRTSGETRLSDFLLWQSTNSVLCFTNVLWPEFTFWHFLAAVFQYQVNYLSLKKMRLSHGIQRSDESRRRIEAFLEGYREKNWAELKLQAETV